MNKNLRTYEAEVIGERLCYCIGFSYGEQAQVALIDAMARLTEWELHPGDGWHKTLGIVDDTDRRDEHEVLVNDMTELLRKHGYYMCNYTIIEPGDEGQGYEWTFFPHAEVEWSDENEYHPWFFGMLKKAQKVVTIMTYDI